MQGYPLDTPVAWPPFMEAGTPTKMAAFASLFPLLVTNRAA